MNLTLELLLAKPIMENEEGLNHLWIRWQGFSGIAEHTQSEFGTTATLNIQLPEGLHRAVNLNGYIEDNERQIKIDLTEHQDVLIEIYTESKVPYDESLITVQLTIGDQQAAAFVPIRLADADELEEPVVNEQVVERLKQLSIKDDARSTPSQHDEFVSIPPRRVEPRVNEYDFLVERYRIDCDGPGRQI
ncbi:hypothetical protein [Paenibacillus kobensis]|uniref:hypothetical protein n=1 Tax=Paenibacillus kobensis TaxID=59841 RepID=UPI000FD735D8|nr:hypothetical protein [Paenibacillus kobensis]